MKYHFRTSATIPEQQNIAPPTDCVKQAIITVAGLLKQNPAVFPCVYDGDAGTGNDRRCREIEEAFGYPEELYQE